MMFETEEDFEDSDLRYYVGRMLEQEEETDGFCFTCKERTLFQDIINEAIELYIEKRRFYKWEEQENETTK